MIKQNRFDKIILFGITVLLIFAPLAFGSVHVWAYCLVEFGVFSLLALWFVDKLLLAKSDTLEWVKTPVNLVLVLLLALIGMQMVPLPSSWIAFFSPRTFADKMQLFEVMEKATDSATQVPSWISLCYYLHPALVEWLKLVAYMGMFFLVLNTARSKRQINILVYVLILVGLFEAVYAVFQVFSVTPKVWWWKSRSGGGRYASGTFIVSNHFAGYMEMVLSLAFGFMIAQKKRSKRLLSGLGSARALMQRVVSWFSPESAQPKLIFFFFVAIIIGVALLLSASRGGIISLGFSMLLMSVLFYTKKRYRKYGLLAIVLCLVAFAYGLHVGIDPTLEKFNNTGGLHKRLYTTKTMIPMFWDYPALGVGWGNFRYLYSRYVPEDYDGVSSSGYSHNDWLEAGTEVGLAGGTLIMTAFGLYLIKIIRIWRNRRDLYALGIGAGVMAGLISIGFHSYFDFNMHIPANPLTLAALLGIGYASVYRQGRGYSESFFYKVRKIPLTRLRRIVIACLILFAFVVSTYTVGRHFFAEAKCPTEWNSTMNLNWSPYLTDIQEAISYNPLNAEYHFKLAGYYMGSRIADEILHKEYNEKAIASLEKAVSLNPARGIYWYDLGKRYSYKSYDPYGYLNKWLPLAEQCFNVGICCAPKDANMLFNVAWYWVWRSSILSEKHDGHCKNEGTALSRKEGIQKFQRLFQRSLELNSHRWKKAADRVWEYFPDDAVVFGIVPDEDEKMKSQVLEFLATKGGR